MKCSICGFENPEDAKFCGNCGKALRLEIKPKESPPTWTWGSMIASLVLIFIFWIFAGPVADSYSDAAILQVILLIIGFPATGYLMYKERTTKIKYGLVWILVPILDLLLGTDARYDEYTAIGFLFFAIPAIIVDFVYVYRKPDIS